MQGRVDLEKYRSACQELENFIPTIQGPAIKRSGTRYVKEVVDTTAKSRLITFEFSTVEAYVLEIAEGTIKPMRDLGAINDTSVVGGVGTVVSVSAADPAIVELLFEPTNLADGDEVYFEGTGASDINKRYIANVTRTATGFGPPWYITLTGVDRTSFSVEGAGGIMYVAYRIDDGDAYTDDEGNAATQSIPWLEADLDDIQYVQSGDVLYLVHPDYPPHKITRTSDTDWVCEKIEFQWPAFRPENSTDDSLIMSSECEGTVEIRLRGRSNDRQACTIDNTSPVNVNVTGHGYTTGDVVYIYGLTGAGAAAINDEHYVITTAGADDFTLDGTSAGGVATAGTCEKILSFAFMFDSGMVTTDEEMHFKIRQIVPADMPDWQPAKDLVDIEVRAAYGIGGYLISDAGSGPVIHWEGNVYTYQGFVSGGSAISGDIPPVHDRLSDGEVSDGSGKWRYWNKGSGYGKLTAVASDGYSATMEVIQPLCPMHADDSYRTDTAGAPGGGEYEQHSTERWSEGAWNAFHGYPRSVAFFEDRLWFGGTNSDPQTFWGSKIGEYEDFEEDFNDPSFALKFTIASDQTNVIEWMAGDQQLVLGTRGGEFIARSGTDEEAITGDNITVRRQSNYGVASGTQPKFVDSSLLFIQRSSERLHGLQLGLESGRYSAPDLTALSAEILRPGAVEIAYQASPFRQAWVRKSDGGLAVLTTVSDEEVLGWSDFTIGWNAATAGANSPTIESITVKPHPDLDEDHLWLIVRRYINGAWTRYIEILEKPFDEDDAIEDGFFVDCGLTYDGIATTEITGLGHLEGETVQVLADGVHITDKTVNSAGSISIPSSTTVQIGYSYDSKLQTMRFEAGGTDGTSHGRRKRIRQLIARLDLTGPGTEFGPDFDHMIEFPSTLGTLFTGDTKSYEMPGGFEREGRVAIRHSDPTPCTVVALLPQLTTEGRG